MWQSLFMRRPVQKVRFFALGIMPLKRRTGRTEGSGDELSLLASRYTILFVYMLPLLLHVGKIMEGKSDNKRSRQMAGGKL